MKAEDYRRLVDLFLAARSLDPESQDAYLSAACAGDEGTRRHVESLLRHAEEMKGFLEDPALGRVVQIPSLSILLGGREGKTSAGGVGIGDEATPELGGVGTSSPPEIPGFRILRVIGTGGMGVVYEAEQEHPRRRVALKVLRSDMIGPVAVRRLEKEAEVLGRLHHPGIAQVYQAGTADVGSGPQPYFAMEYVDGRSLSDHADHRRLGTKDQLELLARVCEAVDHAHAQGIVHRDLKPDNILVGPDGQPKVLDFGIARATDSDLRTTLQTRAGELVGTLSYMSPEQVSGDTASVDARSDIYSLGVIAYELLTGRPPYAIGKQTPIPEAARIIREQEPVSARRIRKVLRGDIETILAKALEKERDRRYGSAGDMAADLRRHLRNEPIRARPPSPAYRFRKFARRHPAPVAAALAASLMAGLSIAESWRRYVRERDEKTMLLQLSDANRLSDLRGEARSLWPARPHRIPELESWLKRAEVLVARLRVHERMLEELRVHALPYDAEAARRDSERHRTSSGLAGLESRLEIARFMEAQGFEYQGMPKPGDVAEGLEDQVAEIRGMSSSRRSFAFSDAETQWHHDALAALVDELRGLLDPSPTGEETIAGVRARLDFARTLEERSIDEHRQEWTEAIRSIRDPKECPRYEGLVITPQIGLVPIGRDPRSGLWEFGHIETGRLPPRDSNGRLSPTEDSGLVFVLIPGGVFLMGAQRTDPSGASYDPRARRNESPVHPVTLRPFFLSKFEMTQAQWVRVMGINPSQYNAGSWAEGEAITSSNPVEQVTPSACTRAMSRLGLEIPTEAQWEYAARAGTSAAWSTGDEAASLDGSANLLDMTYAVRGEWEVPGVEDWLWDGAALHAQVGSYRPNAFGLHDVHGNVSEWCGHFATYHHPIVDEDGTRALFVPRGVVARGGSFKSTADEARTAYRCNISPSLQADIGVRAARKLEP